MKQEAKQERSSTLKRLAVLESIARAEQPVTLSELMRACALPKGTLYHALALFEHAEYVARDSQGRGYVVGPRLGSLALAVVRAEAVSQESHVILSRLCSELGETCNLAVLRKGEVSFFDRVEADWPLRLHLCPGTTLAPHSCASGKLLLALSNGSQGRTFLSSMKLTRLTKRTITDARAFDKELEAICMAGYSVDNEEHAVGLSCVAVPVIVDDKAIAAIALEAATTRMPPRRAMAYVPRLSMAASAIARAMGA